MRAVVVEEFGTPEALRVRELPPPAPAAGEVVVDVQAAGVNFPDLLVVDGSYQILPERPFSPGKEIAGVVDSVGSGVTDFVAGQRVMAQIEHGGYRERVAAPAAQLVPLPDDMSYVDAAAFGMGYLTAYFALRRRARLAAGETVLVTGAGGCVGSASVQLAKALGATVIAVARDERRGELARAQGADHVLPAEPGLLRDRVRECTSGRGADVVVELVGGTTFAEALRATAWEGRLVVIGFAGGEIPVIKAGHLLVKNIAVLGLQASDYRDREPATMRAALGELLELYTAGKLRVPIAGTFPLERAAEALEAVRNGGLSGNVVLTCP
ncbi:MAG: zinc-binding dehydrogenase [Pseudonocardiaceae bacterium]|nr:zinc-binding dehydrogenase [Pseudonocardiaceae bacterium]